MQDNPERWLPAANWPEYQVSNKGRVRSITRWVERKDGRRGCWKQGQLITPVTNSNGYLVVRLFRNDRRTHKQVHALVLETFDPPRPPGQEGRHGRGGQLDNRYPENLCWGTQADNAADRDRDGTTARGERIASAKLTEAIVRECRRRNALGESTRKLAREFGVAQVTMNTAIRGVTWRHVPHGERTYQDGHRVAVVKLTESIVRECRQRYAAGETQSSLAREFGISSGAMSTAIRGINWRHVT